MVTKLFIGLAAALLLCVCAQQRVEESAATAEAGYGRVFGRIELVEEEAWRSKVAVWQRLTLFARSTGSGEMHYFAVEDDGSFYWPLKAGEYLLLGFQVDRPAIAGRPVPVRLVATFSVPRGQAIYIGDARVDMERNQYRFGIIDRYADAVQRVQARAAAGNLATGSALMRFEPPPGQYKQVTEICAASWGLNCSRNYQGVIPTEPGDTAWNYSTVKNFTPLLEWTPSNRAGISYDVAIYESLSFSHTPTASVTDLRGALVAYAEGLREPRWSPPPLQPGRRYQWTVRLRDGDTISSWSTTGPPAVLSFLFTPLPELLFSGIGRFDKYFGFETPR